MGWFDDIIDFVPGNYDEKTLTLTLSLSLTHTYISFFTISQIKCNRCHVGKGNRSRRRKCAPRDFKSDHQHLSYFIQSKLTYDSFIFATNRLEKSAKEA